MRQHDRPSCLTLSMQANTHLRLTNFGIPTLTQVATDSDMNIRPATTTTNLRESFLLVSIWLQSRTKRSNF